jgi:acetyltransferase-like isoleucine patch superfamily enzyme
MRPVAGKIAAGVDSIGSHTEDGSCVRYLPQGGPGDDERIDFRICADREGSENWELRHDRGQRAGRKRSIIGHNVVIHRDSAIGDDVRIDDNALIGKLPTRAAASAVTKEAALCIATSNDNYMGRTEKRFKEYGGVIVRTGGRIGTNATILPNKVVAEGSVVAAGAVLTKDTQPRKIFAGVPAKYFRSGSLYGCQFHPEKSGETGLRMIRKFTELA